MDEIIKIKSVSQVHEFLNLPKPKHPLVSVYKHTEELVKLPYKGIKISSELYQIMLKEGKVGSLGYGRNSYDFEEGTLIFTAPNQVISFGEYEATGPPSGWTLMFHPDLIRKSELGKKIENYSFFSYDVHEALHISDEEKASISEIVFKIEKEYNQLIDQHSQTLMVSNIELLLNYCTRYYDRQFYTRTNLNQDFVSKFEHLLKDYYESDRPFEMGIPTVRYCGQELNMSPNYLSDLLKKETGSNAQEHIHHYLIEKAKTKLIGSTQTISEIAYDLGFGYSQHFAKMFRTKTGMSPSQYRNLN